MRKQQASAPRIVTLSQAAASLEEALPTLTAQLLDRVWGIPGYDEQHLDRAELASYMRPNLLAVIRSLSHPGAAPAESTAAARRIGEARALQGVPIDAMIRSWSTAERVLLDQLLLDAGELPATELRQAVTRLGESIAELTERSVEKYRQIQDEVTAHYDRLTADLVARLAGERPADPDEVRERARTIGVDPDIRYVAMAYAVGSTHGPPSAKAYLRVQRQLLAMVAPRSPGRILIGSVDEFPLLLVPSRYGPSTLAATVGAALRSADAIGDILVGIGAAATALTESGISCHQARDAVSVGRRYGWTNRTVCFADVTPEVLLLRSPDIAAALRDRLTPLNDRPELVETLQAYLDNGLSARAAARSLFVHHNTVPYRLRQIEQLLDVRLSGTTARTELLLGLRARELHDRAAPATTVSAK